MTIPSHVTPAYKQFLELVVDVRPELHRYCSRMTGSIADGEDVVQDTLAKAFFALGTFEELPALRPWLFRVAHNAAIDFTRGHAHARVELVADAPDVPTTGPSDDGADPETVRAALATFLLLPPLQRSAVILKDVVGHSNAEIADTLRTTIPAVKAALVRGRDRLRTEGAKANDAESAIAPSPVLDEYVRLFNAGDWDGVRALLAEEVRLDLVSISQRKGKAVGVYFGRYASEADLRIARGVLDDRQVIWVFTPKSSDRPKYFVELTTNDDGRVTNIRDFRYVTYIAGELDLARSIFDPPHPFGFVDRDRCMPKAKGNGTEKSPWVLSTPPGTSEFEAWRDEKADPPALVVQVKSTQLRYQLRCIDDLHAMLKKHGDWMLLGSADEQKPAAEGTVEAWGRAAKNPVKGFYGIKKGLRGRFGMYVPPVLEVLGLAEVEHAAKNNRMRAKG